MSNTSDQRSLFEIPDNIVYLNAAQMSPLLASVRQAGEKAVSRKSAPWQIGPENFFDETEIARGLFARLINSDADHIALISSATYGITTAIRNVNLRRGDEVVILDSEFPAIYYPLKKACDMKDARLVTVVRSAPESWTEAILQTINANTKVIAFSPTHWTDGSSIDCARIGQKAREVGAALIIDGCQHLGAVPFDVQEVQPDFLIAPTYKWLLGPYSYGFLYVAKRFHQGEPIEEVWCSRAGANDFTNLVQYQEKYQSGARRFDMGERNNFILLPMVIAALQQLLEWSPERIAKHAESITDEISQHAHTNGFQVLPREQRSSHILGLRCASGFSQSLRNRFQEKNIFVSFRGDCMRISPHLHTNRRDIDTFLSELKER